MPASEAARARLREKPERLLLNEPDHDDLVAAAFEMREERKALRESGQWLVEQGAHINGITETEEGLEYVLAEEETQ